MLQDGCFYPANNSHTMKCGEFLVTRMSSEVGDGVTSIKISIENKGAVSINCIEYLYDIDCCTIKQK